MCISVKPSQLDTIAQVVGVNLLSYQIHHIPPSSWVDNHTVKPIVLCVMFGVQASSAKQAMILICCLAQHHQSCINLHNLCSVSHAAKVLSEAMVLHKEADM